MAAGQYVGTIEQIQLPNGDVYSIASDNAVTFDDTLLYAPVMTQSAAGRIIIDDSQISGTATLNEESLYNTLNSSITTINSSIGNITGLNTTASNLVGAINEVKEKCDSLLIEPQVGSITYESGWENYSSSNNSVMLRKYGNLVVFSGSFKNTTSQAFTTSNENHAIGTLSSGFWPLEQISVLCQGSGHTIWTMNITTDGKVYAARCRTSPNANYTANSSSWWPFNITWSLV